MICDYPSHFSHRPRENPSSLYSYNHSRRPRREHRVVIVHHDNAHVEDSRRRHSRPPECDDISDGHSHTTAATVWTHPKVCPHGVVVDPT